MQNAQAVTYIRVTGKYQYSTQIALSGILHRLMRENQNHLSTPFAFIASGETQRNFSVVYQNF